MQTTLSKIIVALCFGCAYILFTYFDQLRQIPGFYCEGFGCIGLGLWYLAIGAVLIPLIVGIIGFTTAKERKIRHAVESLFICALVMLLSIYVVGLLNDLRVSRDMQSAHEAEKQFNETVAQNASEVNTGKEILSIEKVDLARNSSGRGVFQAQMTPDEVLAGTPAVITVSAEIGSVRDVESVTLYSVSDTLAKPMNMHDDGENGDLRASDTIFTIQEEVMVSTQSEVVYEIEVLYTDGYKATSRALPLLVYEPLPEGALIDAGTLAKQVKDDYLAYRTTMNANTARAKVLAETKNNPGVSFAELTGHNLSIIYRGVRLWAMLYGSMDGPPVK